MTKMSETTIKIDLETKAMIAVLRGQMEHETAERVSINEAIKHALSVTLDKTPLGNANWREIVRKKLGRD